MEHKSASTLEKKIRFGQSTKLFRLDNNVEDLWKDHSSGDELDSVKHDNTPSLLSFLKSEVTREYMLENDEERFSAGREKFYLFMKIPKEVEKFMLYGVLHCIDSFLFVYTYLPVRVVLALWALITRPLSKCFGLVGRKSQIILSPAEICDLLKAVILICCLMVLWVVDTNMLYHLIKSQSVIKLYIFYNMLDVGDKLLISLGQDTLDALLWTATEPKGRKREHLGLIPHLFLAIIYVVMHSILILFQATTLSVAVNANNKALLTIMMSNNFVELKGSVFKKFDKNNLFQVSCSDVRERFHLVVLLFIVILQTMKGYKWDNIDILWPLIYNAISVLIAEVFVDWIKHAFITRFNELNIDVYRDYRTSIAYDLNHKLEKQAFSGHSDIVARRMGFIALPLGILFARVFFASVDICNVPATIIFIIGYIWVWSWKILITIIIFGKASSIIAQHKLERTTQNSPINSSRESKYRSVATSPQHLIMQGQPRKNLGSYTFPFKNSEFTNSYVNLENDLTFPNDLSASSAIFANSTVDLKEVTLNEEMLKVNGEDARIEPLPDDIVTRSVPNIKKELREEDELKNDIETLKKSESEPSLVNLTDNQV